MKWILKLLIILSICAISCDKKDSNDTTESSNWTQLGGSFESQIYDVIADNDGNIYMSGGELSKILKWDGTNWGEVGNVETSPFTGGLYWPITIDKDGNVYAVGRIKVPQANSEYHVAKWVKSSNQWINLTSGQPLFDNGIYSLVTDNSRNLYVSGNAQFLNSVERGNYIYRWDGNSWNVVGGKLSSEFAYMHIDSEDNLYSSLFNMETFSPCISKWNGSRWEELGGTNSCKFGTGQVFCINSDSKGNVFAGGHFIVGDSAFNVFKWTKSTNSWRALYTYGSSLDVNSMTFDTADTLYVAGKFVNSSNTRYVAKYHGDKWSNYGNLNANNTIHSICFDKLGNMYAGGEFTNGNGKYYVAICKKK